MGVIVLGYDDSRCAHAALDVAVELARAFSDRIVIGFGAAPPGAMGEEARAHAAAIEEIGLRVTASGVELARAAGIEVEVEIVGARPAQALLDLAERHDARMIVLGTHGEAPLRSAIVGSTPQRLLHLSRRPVVVVPVR
jgi:nucleotide-binding universal stress UspA family protein